MLFLKKYYYKRRLVNKYYFERRRLVFFIEHQSNQIKLTEKKEDFKGKERGKMMNKSTHSAKHC
jgi:hypothetical protein